MRLAVGILCYNQLENHRTGVFADTLASIQKAEPDVLVVADNGSTDGTTDRLSTLDGFVGFPKLAGFPNGNTCGYGMNKLAAYLKTLADVVVLSNDDVVWQSTAFQTLKEIWSAAPDELTIISGLVQPTYQIPGQPAWNEPLGVAEIAGHKLLVRRSVPGGAWSYQTKHHDLIFPVSTFPGVDDVPACHKLTDSGRGVACINLASHAGESVSTWGNGSDRFQTETVTELEERFDL